MVPKKILISHTSFISAPVSDNVNHNDRIEKTDGNIILSEFDS